MITRRTFLTVAAAATVAGCRTRQPLTDEPPLDTSPVSTSPGAPSSIVMIGDSITVGAQPVLEKVFKRMGFLSVAINAEKSRRIDVGSGKYEPKSGTQVATYVTGLRPQPEVWAIALGTNDAGQYKDAAEYRAVIAKMLAIVPSTVPLAWIDNYRGDHLPGSVLFNQELRESLRTRGHAVVGDWYQQCVKPDARVLGSDGIHPNKKGVLVFADTVRLAVQALMLQEASL